MRGRGGIRMIRLGAPFIVAIAALAPLGVVAADVRQGPQVGVGAGDSIQDDLYAFAGTIDVAGTINGSLVAAGGTITISGPVHRDVMVSGGNITITGRVDGRSEEHTSELQSRFDLVCRLLLEKKKE